MDSDWKFILSTKAYDKRVVSSAQTHDKSIISSKDKELDQSKIRNTTFAYNQTKEQRSQAVDTVRDKGWVSSLYRTQPAEKSNELMANTRNRNINNDEITMIELSQMLNACVDGLWAPIIGSLQLGMGAEARWLPVPSELEELIVDIKKKNMILHKKVAYDTGIADINADKEYLFAPTSELLKLLQNNPDLLSIVAISIVEKYGALKSYKVIDSAIINGLLSFISVEEDRCIAFIRSVATKASSDAYPPARKLDESSLALDNRPASHAALIHSLKSFALRPLFVRYLEVAWNEPLNELRAQVKSDGGEMFIQPVYYISKFLDALMRPKILSDSSRYHGQSSLSTSDLSSSIPSSIARVCLILESQATHLFQMIQPAVVIAEEFLFEMFLAPALKCILQALSGELSQFLIAKIVNLFVTICKRSVHLSGSLQNKILYDRSYIASSANPLREPFAEDLSQRISQQLRFWLDEIRGPIGGKAVLTQGYPSQQNVIKARPEEISDLLVLSSDDLKLIVDIAMEIDSTKRLAESCMRSSLLTTATAIDASSESSIYIEPGVISLVNQTEANIWWAIDESKGLTAMLGRAQIIQNIFSENRPMGMEAYRKEVEKLILSLHKYKGEAPILQRYTEKLEKALSQIKLYSKLFHVDLD